jgi:hypothetical protein
MWVNMFQLRVQLLYFIITTVLSERQYARSIIPNEVGNDKILHDANGQKPMREEAHLNDWRLPQLDEGVAVLDIIVCTPRSTDKWIFRRTH